MNSWWMIAAVGLMPVALSGCDESPLEAAQEVDSFLALEPADGAGGFGPAGRILDLSDELGLTDEQVSDIQSILTALREENSALLEGVQSPDGPPFGGRPGGQESNPAFQQARENVRAAMEAIQEVLTEEQSQLAETLRQERGSTEGRPGRRGPGGGFPEGAAFLRMAEQLGLSDEQVASIQAIQESLWERIEAIREELRTSGERPDGEPNPLVEELRAQMEAAREQMRGVLTEQQLATLEALREARPQGERFRGGRPGGGRAPG